MYTKVRIEVRNQPEAFMLILPSPNRTRLPPGNRGKFYAVPFFIKSVT